QADKDEGKAELQETHLRMSEVGGCECSGAGCAVEERNSEKEKRRGKRTEQEIFQSRFAGLKCVAAVSGENVAGDGTHFEANECGEKLLRGGENAHAGSCEENECEKFGRIEIFGFEIGLRSENHEECDGAEKQVEEEAESVRENQAGE